MNDRSQMTRIKQRRKITVDGVVRYLVDVGEIVFPKSRKAAFRQFYNPKFLELEDYFPSEIERIVGRLERKGWVEKRETPEGTKVILTGDGKKKVWLYDLEKLTPKKTTWDGKWRMVIFDVEEKKKRMRNNLRRYLAKLGFWQMQRSVWVCPWDCENELKYIREILEVPSEVKWVVVDKIENDEDLRKMFGV